jgi:hypothetical protein
MAGWLWLRIGLGLGSDFQVVRAGERITIRGNIARSKHGRLREFVGRDLGDAGAFALAGTSERGRPLRLRWAGRLDPFTRQRIRNFLVELLR